MNDGSKIRHRPLFKHHICSYDFVMNRTADGRSLYSPATLERVSVEAGAGEVIEDRARLLEFQIGP